VTATLAVSRIVAAHAAALPTLPGWSGVTVVDGPLLRGDGPNRYVTLGYVAGEDTPVASFTPLPSPDGNLHESGEVASLLVVGGDTMPAARDAALTLLGAWAGWLTADRTMAGRVIGDSEAHLSVDLSLAFDRQNRGIARARVVVTYTAHTYG
jgi:hypothetical protein